jgi:hypothetical protein
MQEVRALGYRSPRPENRRGVPGDRDPDRIAGGSFVRVPGQDCRRLFRPGSRTRLPPAISFGLHHDGSTTCAIASKRRTRHTSAEPWRGATLPRFQAARSRFKTTPSPRDVVTGSRCGRSAARRSCGDPLYDVSSVCHPSVRSTGVVTSPSRSHPCGFEPPLREPVTTSLRVKSPERPQGGRDSQGKARSLVGPSLGSFDREAVERRGRGGLRPPPRLRSSNATAFGARGGLRPPLRPDARTGVGPCGPSYFFFLSKNAVMRRTFSSLSKHTAWAIASMAMPT